MINVVEYVKRLFRGDSRNDYPIIPSGVQQVSPSYTDISYTEINQYYNQVHFVKRAIRDLVALAFLYGTNYKRGSDENEFAKLCARQLLLHGFVVVTRKEREILKPDLMQPYILPNFRKLYGIRYLWGLSYRWFVTADLALVTLDASGEFPGVSPLQGIKEELASFILERTILLNQKKQGSPTRLALLLDSTGMGEKDRDKERANIKTTILGTDNAGVPLVAFSQGGKGQIVELKGNFAIDEYEKFSAQVFQAVAVALGLPTEYIQPTTGSSLSDSRSEMTDYVTSYTVTELQTLIEHLMSQLGISFKFNEYVSKVVMAQRELDLKEQSIVNQEKLLLGDSSGGSIQKSTAGRPSRSVKKTS